MLSELQMYLNYQRQCDPFEEVYYFMNQNVKSSLKINSNEQTKLNSLKIERKDITSGILENVYTHINDRSQLVY